MDELKKDLFRFILVGLGSNTINFFTYILIYFLFENLLIGTFLGYIFGLYFSFYFGRIWVFGKIYEQSNSKVIRFIAVYLLGLLLMTSIVEISTNYYMLNYKTSWLIAATVTFFNNFVGSKWFVFK